jgi:alpha-glucosidase
MQKYIASCIGFVVLLGCWSTEGFCGEPVNPPQRVKLVSPNGKIEVSVSVKEMPKPYPAGERLYYSINFKGKRILLDSPTELIFKDIPPLTNLKIKKQSVETIDERWQRVAGKSKDVRNHCNQLRLALEEDVGLHRRIDFVFRAYDDGVAFRYYLPKQEHIGDFNLKAEETFFKFGDNHTVWAADYKGFVSHQESEFNQMKLSELSAGKPAKQMAGKPYGVPLLVRVDESIWAAITEANITDWAGMYLGKVENDSTALVTILSPHPNDPNVAVSFKTPRYSPWRVVMLGEKPGDLIESNIIENLNEPSVIKDTSWIKPGKCAWDWWWCGKYAPDVNFTLGSNTATMKYFIDFASEMGWEYQLIDWYWYGPPFKVMLKQADPNADITKSNPDINIPELVRYANGKNVRLLLWLHWQHVDKQMDKAFALYEKWGIAGVKIDFMMRDDQDMVNFYHRAVKKAAQHHLLVDFHGAYKPDGFSRTYPNLITREGVLGNEWNKWSARVTPDHCLTIPFTRMLAGPMDFTPGGFLNVRKDDFKFGKMGADVGPVYVMGTRCFQLAMMVAYESPLQVLCDSPYNYRNNPAGLDFLKIVPTTWDQTRVLNAQVGDFITIARRKGNEWFVGSMTDWTPRSLEIPLDFLGGGKYEASIWADANDAETNPVHLTKQNMLVTAKDKITAKLAPAGGQVIHLKPAK